MTPADLAARFVSRLDLFLRESGVSGATVRVLLKLNLKNYREIEHGFRLPTWQELCLLGEISGHDPLWFFEQDQNIHGDPGTLLVHHLRKAEQMAQELWKERRERGEVQAL